MSLLSYSYCITGISKPADTEFINLKLIIRGVLLVPKYKVGDKVKVKDNLAHRSGYCMAGGRHSNSVVPEMLRLRGKIVTIKEAEDAGYRIGEDNGAWCWTDDMFCGAAHSQKYKVGDKVVVSEDIRDDDSVYYMEHGEDEGMYATGDMVELRGRTVTITSADEDGYTIKEDDEEFVWTDEMFSGLAYPLQYKVGDKVKIRTDLPPFAFPDGMLAMRGVVATIAAVGVVDCPGKAPGYSIKEDGEMWVWSEADFDGLVKAAKPKTPATTKAGTQVPCDETKTIKKEKKSMKFNLKNMLKQYMPRSIDDGSVALSISGDIAYRRKDGDYVFYDPEAKSINNCMELVFGSDALDKMVFVMPAKDVHIGDVVLNNGKYIYITNITETGAIKGVSLDSGRTTTLVKEINTIMGCLPYAKVTSLFSMANGKGSDGINPMLLMLMGDTDDADDLFTTIAMMTMMGGNTATAAPAGGMFGGMNPLMLLALSGDDDEGGKGGLMQMILMSQMMGGGLFQAPAAPTTSAQ